MAEDTGFTQINDIVLDIPPQNIHVERSSFPNQWKTLRTQASIKSKSGFSTLEVSMSVIFTDNPSTSGSLSALNGIKKLRNLISQFRVTPFCYVENQLIRSAALGSDTQQKMMLALKQIEIRKINNPDLVNGVEVEFSFCWFNYFPYTPKLSYKKNLFSTVEVSNPADSEAWKILYKAEQKRNRYKALQSIGSSNVQLGFNQFASLTQKEYKTLEKEYSALETLREDVSGYLAGRSGDNDFHDIPQRIKQTLRESLEDGKWADTLSRDIFGDSTSMYEKTRTDGNEKDVLKEVLEILDQNIGYEANSRYSVIAARGQWKPVVLRDGEEVDFKSSAHERKQSESSSQKDRVILLERKRVLDLEKIGFTVTGVVISFENILAMMPIIGHPYPSYQHIGSQDFYISIIMETTTQQSVRDLSDFYSAVESQFHTHRKIPAGHRNIAISNDLINMCGVHFVIGSRLTTENIEGSPGSYRAVLEVIDDPLNPNTQEKIAVGQSFTSNNELRLQIAKVLEENLKLIDDPLVTITGKKISSSFASRGSLGSKFTEDPSLNLRPLKPGTPGASQVNKDAYLDLKGQTVTGKAIGSENQEGEKGYYVYTAGTNPRKETFRKLCQDYGVQMGNLFEKLFRVLRKLKRGQASAAGDVENFFATFSSLTNQDVFSIEKVKDDIIPLIKQIKGSGIPEKEFNNADELNNRMREINNSSQPEDFVQDTFDSIKASRNQKSVNLLINGILSEWMQFTISFLDKILHSDLKELPEFLSVKDKMKQISVSSSIDCYPDFPMKEVIAIMQTAKDEDLSISFRHLQNLFNQSKLSLKNLGLNVLLNPDFYFFNSQNDVVDQLLPGHIVNTAVNGIKKSRQAMHEAESDWFKNVYETTYLSEDKVRAIDDNVLKPGPGEDETSDYKTYQQELQKSIINRVAPNLLQGNISPSLSSLQEIGEPVSLPASTIEEDTLNIRNNYIEGATTLTPNPASYECQHRFDTTEVLETLSEGSYTPPEPFDPNKEPIFIHPLPPGFRNVTSSFGPRKRPIAGASKNHQGTDFASETKTPILGTPVSAAEGGKIIHATFSPQSQGPGGGKLGNQGVSITIQHAKGWKTKYFHMQWTPFAQEISRRFWQGGKRNSIPVSKGQVIGTVGNTGHGSGPHLHFEMHKNGIPRNAEPLLALDFPNKSQGPLVTIDPNNESLLSKSIDQLEKDLRNGQGYTMNRAYPTFKLYFIESDLGERKYFSFDDFFSYSSVVGFRVIRTRKIVADLAQITLTNISGTLSNRQFFDKRSSGHHQDANGNQSKEDRLRAGTIEENPIAHLMLQPGIEIELRAGYSNNPEELTTMFSGKITEVDFSSTDDLVNITCQSFGTELVQNIQGEAKTFGGTKFWIFPSDTSKTGKLLENLMASPELVHFGRWEGGDIGTNSLRGVLQKRWKLNPSPQDDNIFAPTGTSGSLLGLLQGSSKYLMYNTTIWDVIQEMTLRHPSYIASVVPYKGKFGTRATMFFGVPDQLYFSRDPDPIEDSVVAALKRVVKDGNEDDASDNARARITEAQEDPTAEDFQDATETNLSNKTSQERQDWFKRVSKQYALNKGIVKPFRSYHIATSSMHIIDNSIGHSGHNTFNTVTLQYSKKDPEANEKTASVEFTNIDTFTLLADAGIPDEEKRELFLQFPNCVGYEQAKAYCTSALFQALKEAYKGHLTIIGDPSIKPYDIVYIFDEYTDMYGPIEVEQVVHEFTQETGFVTSITPDLVVHVNQYATLSTSDAMGLMAEHALKSIGMESLGSIMGSSSGSTLLGAASSTAVGAGLLGGLGGAANLALTPLSMMFFNSSENAIGKSGPTSALGMIGVFIFRKLITRTQLAHPFRFSPLVLDNRPMIGGLPNRYTDGSFIQTIGKWFKETDNSAPLFLSDISSRMNPNNWWRPQGEFSSFIFGE